MILIGNDNRHQRIILDFKGGMINTIVHTFFHLLRLNAHPVVMFHNGPGTGLERIQFTLRIAGGRILMASPVVQHLRDMHDLIGFFRTTENKIIILCPIKFLSQTAYLLHQLPLHNKLVTDIVDAG